MNSTLLLQTSSWLLVATALGGLVMAYIRGVRKVNPPSWLAMVHGFLSAAGLTLLAYAAFAVGVPTLAWWGLGALLLAAVGGVVMNLGYHLANVALPMAIVAAHAVLAVAGFLMLLMAAFGS